MDRVRFAWVLGMALKGTADEIARAETYGQSKGEDDAAEEDAKSQFHNNATDLQVIQNSGRREHQDQPLDA